MRLINIIFTTGLGVSGSMLHKDPASNTMSATDSDSDDEYAASGVHGNGVELDASISSLQGASTDPEKEGQMIRQDLYFVNEVILGKLYELSEVDWTSFVTSWAYRPGVSLGPSRLDGYIRLRKLLRVISTFPVISKDFERGDAASIRSSQWGHIIVSNQLHMLTETELRSRCKELLESPNLFSSHFLSWEEPVISVIRRQIREALADLAWGKHWKKIHRY